MFAFHCSPLNEPRYRFRIPAACLYKHARKLLSGEKIMRICTAIKESQHFTMLKIVHHQHQKVLIC